MKRALAANARRLRVAHSLSLSELARATGISKATLSGIERGNANPTVDTLAALAGAFHVPVGELLEGPELAPVRIVRADRAARERSERTVSRMLDAIAVAGDLELVELDLPARHAEEIAPRAPGARTQLLVLQGKLIAGPVERVSELGAGDYISFPADVPHQVEAAARPARAFVLTHLPR